MPEAAVLEAFIACVEAGQHVKAVQDFYATGATMRENLGPVRVGRDVHVANEQRVLARAQAVHSTCVRPVFVDGDHVVIRWKFHFIWRDGTQTHLEELAYQRWAGNLIEAEQFFYDPVQMNPRPVAPPPLAV